MPTRHPASAVALTAAAALVAASALAAPAFAQVGSVVFKAGDVIAGTDGNPVVDVSWARTNNIGGYVFGFETQADADAEQIDYIWGSVADEAPRVLVQEGVVDGATQDTFETRKGLFDSGAVVYSAQDSDPATVVDDYIFFRDSSGSQSIIATERDPVPGVAGAFYTILSSAQAASTSGTPYFLGRYSNTPGGTNVGIGLFAGTSPAPLIRTGDAIGGTSVTVANNIAGYNVSNAGGLYIAVADVAGAGVTTANNRVVVINGQAATVGGTVVQEGNVLPASAGGIGGEAYQTLDTEVVINASGSFFFSADTDGPVASDALLVGNDGVVLREGQTLAGPSGADRTLNGSISVMAINSDGDYAVEWSVTQLDGTGLDEALVFNDQILLVEDGPIDFNGDGVIDADDGGAVLRDIVVDSIGITPRIGDVVDVYFEGVVDFDTDRVNGNDVQAALRVSVVIPEPSGLGLALAGALPLLARRRRR